MSTTSGKIWGLTQLIESNHAFEFHRIEVKAGGFCSLHKHVHKFNGFFVESGELKISVQKQDYGLTDVTVLGAGDWTTVAPGEYHMFEATEDTVAYEVYWAPMLVAEDIERRTVGGTGGHE